MLNLNQSPVVFDEATHHYRLSEKRLSGITTLIHEVLHLGIYPEASDYVKRVLIPKAGEYGTSVHKAIEFFDNTGLRATEYSGKYADYNVSTELDNYIRLRGDYKAIANEYTVSDEDKWASNIDNVWADEDGGIWLVDTKTNNTKLYPGGVDGLKQYLSWQLSIYAYLFERQNPELKVKGLMCNWFKLSEYAQWEIERKSDDEVRWLLDATYEIKGDIITNYQPSTAERPQNAQDKVIAPKHTELPTFGEDAINLIVQVKQEYEEAKQVLEEMKEQLRTAMEDNGVKSWDSGAFKATIANDSTTKSFDTTRLKKEMPDIYERYLVEKPKKGGFTITMKKS